MSKDGQRYNRAVIGALLLAAFPAETVPRWAGRGRLAVDFCLSWDTSELRGAILR